MDTHSLWADACMLAEVMLAEVMLAEVVLSTNQTMQDGGLEMGSAA